MSENASPSRKKLKLDATVTTKHLFDPETQDYAVLSKKPTYVDHTPFNAIFFKPVTKLFVSAPKMFCKSSNMNMLRQFFEIDKDGNVHPNWKKRPQYEIFKDTDIVTKGQENDLKNHLGAHPVVFVDLKGSVIRTYENALMHCYKRIKSAFETHMKFLLNNVENKSDKKLCKKWFESTTYQEVDLENVISGLEDLCKVLYRAHKGKRVLILIDECDAVIVSALRNNAPRVAVEQSAQLMSAMLSKVTKGTDIAEAMVQGVLLTGVSYISGVGYSQDVKVIACRFLDDSLDPATGFQRDKIIPFFGIYEDQLDGILEKLKGSLNDGEKRRIKDEIQHNFNGYRTKIGQKCIYPLHMVVTYLMTEEILEITAPTLFNAYQNVRSDPRITPHILTMVGSNDINVEYSDDKIDICDLIKMRSNPNKVRPEIFFNLLLELGLLTYAEKPSSTRKLRMPNQTTIKYFLKTLEKVQITIGIFDNELQQKCATHINHLVRYFRNSETEEYEKTLISLYQGLKSLFKGFKKQDVASYNENALQGLMFVTLNKAISVTGFSSVFTELQMTDNDDRRGRIDIWMLEDNNKKFAIIWELKYNALQPNKYKTSIHALQEIRGQAAKPGREDVVRYIDKFEQRGIKDYFMVGLTVDKEFRPSISIATSKDEKTDPAFFTCISETEAEDYKGLYQRNKCRDLLHTRNYITTNNVISSK